jgi:HAD superfamily hydrolase (TIGR01459 family)
MSATKLPRVISGLQEIASDYDVVICDVWGVVHNGREPFAAAADALARFRASRGRVILLTNAPRLAADVAAQFERIGVPHDCYDAIVSSGQAAREELIRRSTAAPPLAVYKLGPERDRATWEGLDLHFVEPEDADLVLCTGPFNDEVETPDDYRDLLARFKARDLLMLCANPDITVRRGDSVVYCAGAIARAYQALGGEVVYFGKPYPAIFEAALAKANPVADVRPLVIGDGIETDISGANAMGWGALFITGGLIGAEIGNLPHAEADARLADLFAAHGVRARARMELLTW